MNLRNAVQEGAEITPGQEPEIADGVQGIWFDLPDAVYIAYVFAIRSNEGAVGRMLDALPNQRRIVVSNIINPQLREMLARRGFRNETVERDGVEFEAMVREAS